MSEDTQVEAHVGYSTFRRKIKVFLTPNDKLDELKTQLNKYFLHLGENQTTFHVFVQVSCVDLGAGKDEDMWKTFIFHRLFMMMAM